MALAYERIGGVLLDQGKRGEAFAAFQQRLAIAQRLAAGDPGNAEWQRDLAIATAKIGDVYKGSVFTVRLPGGTQACFKSQDWR